MRKIFYLFIFIAVCLNGYSQDGRVYEGNSTAAWDLIYTIK